MAYDPSLAWFVKASGDNDAFAQSCADEALAMVRKHIGAVETVDAAGATTWSNPHGVPQSLIDRAVLEVGADLYYRQAARNGIVSFGSGVEATSVIRINRDPMTQAYSILGPFLPMGFA